MADLADRPLTPKEAAFVEEFMVDFNATQAAIRAGYSAKTAGQAGARLLKNVKVASALQRKAEERQKRVEGRIMDADEVLVAMSKIGRARLPIFKTKDGDPYIDLTQADDDALYALQAAEVEDFVDKRERDEAGEVVARDVRRVKIKLESKVAALGMLGKHHGLLTERVKLEGGFAEELAAAITRADQQRTG